MSTELFAAIEQHNVERLAALLSSGADPNILQAQAPGWSPLHAAIEELEHGGSIEALVLLLRYGASVNIWDVAHDATPLLMALFRGQMEAVRLLLASGADPNVVGGEGDSPLRWSVEQDDLATTAMLLRCGATRTIDVGGGPSGMNALGQAAYRLNVAMVELLLAAGASSQALDADQRTAQQCMPLRQTVDGQRWDRIRALLHPIAGE